MKTTEPIRNPKHVAKLINYYLHKNQMRNYLMISICVYTALRISDVLAITSDQVYDFKKKRLRNLFTITEQKTQKSKTIPINDDLRKALTYCIPLLKPGKALILNENTGNAISRIQAYRLIRRAAEDCGIQENVSCHSLRKILGYYSWKKGAHSSVIMEIYNHSSLAITQRYLGITQDEKNAVYFTLSFDSSSNDFNS